MMDCCMLNMENTVFFYAFYANIAKNTNDFY